MLWSFVEGCFTGQVKLDECGPVFSLAGIAVMLVLAIGALVVMLLKRKSESQS